MNDDYLHLSEFVLYGEYNASSSNGISNIIYNNDKFTNSDKIHLFIQINQTVL